jgi:hypothetical protein
MIKAFIKDGLYAPGLTCIAEKVRFCRRIIEVKLDINITGERTFSEACPSQTFSLSFTTRNKMMQCLTRLNAINMMHDGCNMGIDEHGKIHNLNTTFLR